MFLYITYILGLIYWTNFIIGLLYHHNICSDQSNSWTCIQAHTFSIFGSLYYTNLITLDHSSIPIYTNSWATRRNQFPYPSSLFLGLLYYPYYILDLLLFLVSYSRPIFYFSVYFLGLIY